MYFRNTKNGCSVHTLWTLMFFLNVPTFVRAFWIHYIWRLSSCFDKIFLTQIHLIGFDRAFCFISRSSWVYLLWVISPHSKNVLTRTREEHKMLDFSVLMIKMWKLLCHICDHRQTKLVMPLSRKLPCRLSANAATRGLFGFLCSAA